jgi:crossover junction endodeoxyribonuclease RuvC
VKIIGIDPGTHRIGYSILEKSNQSITVLEYDTIEIPPKTDYALSLQLLEKSLLGILNKFKPNLASVEELFFFKNTKTAGTVYQARGVILLCLIKKKIPILEPTITQIKKGITGNGNADKNQIKLGIKLLLGLEPKGKDDSWDAIAAAYVGLAMSKNSYL